MADSSKGLGIVPVVAAAVIAAAAGAGGYHWLMRPSAPPAPASATRSTAAVAKPDPAPTPAPAVAPTPEKPKVSEAEALRLKVFAAHGGEKAAAKRALSAAFASETRDGKVFARGRIWWRAPDARAIEFDVPAGPAGGAATKHRIVFDGKRAGFQGGKTVTPELTELMRLDTRFFEPADWATLYRSVELGGEETLGSEPALKVIKVSTGSMRVIDYYATRTSLLVARDTAEYDAGSKSFKALHLRYSDHRPVDGIPVPHTITTLDDSKSVLTVMRLTGFSWDGPIPDGTFTMP
ncbi:MAG TPA: hypothetical protein PK264_11115 [Hyphomicrobiaceae bacterium]|nr:hypothetical protein [Hyphomicrobiaceae bacterium]